MCNTSNFNTMEVKIQKPDLFKDILKHSSQKKTQNIQKHYETLILLTFQ